MIISRFLTALCLMCCALSPLAAQEDVDRPQYEEREGWQYRQMPGRMDWDDLPQAEKQRLREAARRWQTLNRDRQRHIRDNFVRFRSLPEEEQQRIRNNFRRYQSLPEDERRQLRERFRDRRPPRPPGRFD